MNFEPWIYAIIAAGAVSVALFLLYTMKTGGKKEKETLEPSLAVKEESPLIEKDRSVTVTDAKRAKDDLRTLDLEREILSFAIRRLYEAHAEEKITEEERERLAQKYKSRMAKIKETISRSESIVALHELETMRDDLMKLFSERFDEVNKKIEDIRSHIEIKPIIEEPALPPPSAPPVKEKRRVRRRPKLPAKTEAEKRIEEIRAEVEKVLERLGQIEVEA